MEGKVNGRSVGTDFNSFRSGPLSSTQDLTTLGWSVPRIIEKLNPHRGYTICHEEDIMVNKFIAAIDKRWMYNLMKGPVIPLGDIVTDSVSQTSTAWRYDNTENSYPFTTTWNQTWTETTSATLSVAAAGSEFAITIGSESTKSETKETSTTISNSWEFIVGPGETLSVERTIVTTNGKSIYEQEYDFQGEICTNGEPTQQIQSTILCANIMKKAAKVFRLL
ncbi:hypothetical protein C8Q75DRAFT_730946 [Abortiporus biennis]|nr:hypothetical protein C8Q75DRAFT_730946 [Abortiporus biennis]